MSFRDLISAAQSQALMDALLPSELSVWERYCREYSTRFATPLLEVRKLDALFVITQVSADNLSEFQPEEQMDALLEMLGSLQDPEYDVKKERAIREEMRKIEEEEEQRLAEKRAIHPSLEKDKRVITKDQPKSKELSKYGSINLSYLGNNKNER